MIFNFFVFDFSLLTMYSNFTIYWLFILFDKYISLSLSPHVYFVGKMVLSSTEYKSNTTRLL